MSSPGLRVSLERFAAVVFADVMASFCEVFDVDGSGERERVGGFWWWGSHGF